MLVLHKVDFTLDLIGLKIPYGKDFDFIYSSKGVCDLFVMFRLGPVGDRFLIFVGSHPRRAPMQCEFSLNMLSAL